MKRLITFIFKVLSISTLLWLLWIRFNQKIEEEPLPEVECVFCGETVDIISSHHFSCAKDVFVKDINK